MTIDIKGVKFIKSIWVVYCLIEIFLIDINQLNAQQILDSTFAYKVENPVYPLNSGPIIHIDEYHNNDMSINVRMFPLLKLLRHDGYRIQSYNDSFSTELLNEVEILVIIGALHKSNINNWKLPTPSALTDSEMNVLLEWIDNGGSLLLVADHMPFPGAIQKFSSKLGVNWYNGFVIDSINWGMTVFSRRDNTLLKHPIIEGKNKGEKVNWVATYYGSGFKIENDSIIGLLSFNNPNIVSYQTEQAWKIYPETPIVSFKNLYQGAILKKGKGRVAFIGEASLFSAQLVGEQQNPVGLNFQNENQNLQFVLNIFHWLSKEID
ncbi:hypothetical protein [Urechidicola vernalis]|uniref:DUF4350 domain-containing protein n=1 Tax=Urechidicola vernalis TaxID=3075600 RepID=A0ABU2Y5D6_9FLAO|nr:hypothetical protein [Urechidicola sp. P050]MDT0553418.1 hypothetical protein [Urechidicola sp. P050]